MRNQLLAGGVALALAALSGCIATATMTQTTTGTATVDDVVEIDADKDFIVADRNAECSNQANIAGNTVVINIAAVDTLGLVGRIDDFGSVPVSPGENGLMASSWREHKKPDVNATALCEQMVGKVKISVGSAKGFGELPPHSAIFAFFNTTKGDEGFQLSSTATLTQTTTATGSVTNIVDNDYDVDIVVGVRNAIATCQLMVSANTFVLNLASVRTTGAVQQPSSGTNDGNNDAEIPTTPEPAPVESRDFSANHGKFNEDTKATCRQVFEEISISVGSAQSGRPES